MFHYAIILNVASFTWVVSLMDVLIYAKNGKTTYNLKFDLTKARTKLLTIPGSDLEHDPFQKIEVRLFDWWGRLITEWPEEIIFDSITVVYMSHWSRFIRFSARYDLIEDTVDRFNQIDANVNQIYDGFRKLTFKCALRQKLWPKVVNGEDKVVRINGSCDTGEWNTFNYTEINGTAIKTSPSPTTTPTSGLLRSYGQLELDLHQLDSRRKSGSIRSRLATGPTGTEGTHKRFAKKGKKSGPSKSGRRRV